MQYNPDEEKKLIRRIMVYLRDVKAPESAMESFSVVPIASVLFGLA